MNKIGVNTHLNTHDWTIDYTTEGEWHVVYPVYQTALFKVKLNT